MLAVTMRKRKSLFWLLVMLVALTSAGWLAAQRITEAARTRALTQAAYDAYYNHLDAALWDWNIAHRAESLCTLDTYPLDFGQLATDGFLKELPDNPFGPGKMIELKPGQPNRIGGFRYIPQTTRYQLDDGSILEDSPYYMVVLYTPSWLGRQKTDVFARPLGSGPHMVFTALQGYRGDNWGPPKSQRVRQLQARVKKVYEATDLDAGMEAALRRLGY